MELLTLRQFAGRGAIFPSDKTPRAENSCATPKRREMSGWNRHFHQGAQNIHNVSTGHPKHVLLSMFYQIIG
jgi:hypothetical protein